MARLQPSRLAILARGGSLLKRSVVELAERCTTRKGVPRSTPSRETRSRDLGIRLVCSERAIAPRHRGVVDVQRKREAMRAKR